MTDRLRLSMMFLKSHGWGQARRRPLADDASFRRYERLYLDGRTAVLMDAPPTFEDVRPFMAVAHYLRKSGLAAPEVIASDLENGFLLLEDMGNDIFASVINQDATRERILYQLAIDGLIYLHRLSPAALLPVKEDIYHALPQYNSKMLFGELALFTDWYVPAVKGKPLTDMARQSFMDLWQEPLNLVVTDLNCLVLRDYHAQNLMLKADQDDLAQLGLLDFQDAVIGHRAYDLVSILQDARRDVSPDLEQEMIQRYLSEIQMDAEIFQRDYAILGAQRHAKIIGIFTRLYLRDGKADYLKLIPRVWALLMRDLGHPSLGKVKDWIETHIPHEIREGQFMPMAFMPEKAMILAAGLGLRMRPLTHDCPKPLIRVAGKELLAYSLDALCAAGVRDVVVNVHYRADQMVKYTSHYYDHRLQISLSDEREQLMDSGGGVKHALAILGDKPFLLLNSDMIWHDGPQPMLQRLQAFWQDDKMDILMLLVPTAQANGYDGAGDYHRDDSGRLRPRGQDKFADYVYGGIMIMKPDCFTDSPEGPFSLRLQFDRAAASGRLYGVIHDGEWYHVGTPEARDQMEAEFGEKS